MIPKYILETIMKAVFEETDCKVWSDSASARIDAIIYSFVKFRMDNIRKILHHEYDHGQLCRGAGILCGEGQGIGKGIQKAAENIHSRIFPSEDLSLLRMDRGFPVNDIDITGLPYADKQDHE